LDRFDDALGRTDLAGGLGDFKTALGVNDNTHARMLATDAGNLLRRKPLVHRAIALPKNDPGLAKRFRSVSSEFLVRIPHDHLIEGDAHAIPGIAPKMLIGEEKNLFAWLESPLQNLRGVGAGANRAAVFARDRKSTRLTPVTFRS